MVSSRVEVRRRYYSKAGGLEHADPSFDRENRGVEQIVPRTRPPKNGNDEQACTEIGEVPHCREDMLAIDVFKDIEATGKVRQTIANPLHLLTDACDVGLGVTRQIKGDDG